MASSQRKYHKSYHNLTCNFPDCRGHHRLSFCSKFNPGNIPDNILKQVLDSNGCPRCLRSLDFPRHDGTCQGFYVMYKDGIPFNKYTDCPNDGCTVRMENGSQIKLNKRICPCALQKQKAEVYIHLC